MSYSSLRNSKALDLSLGNWDKVLLLFLTDGVICEVGALYLTLTGGSGFLAVLLDELKSLLKLEEGKKKERKMSTKICKIHPDLTMQVKHCIC